ncbi:MAG: endonuclease/exonuclease/phosphatase family protein [Acidobacteriaceae bacterium]|nr:endonuclease/exonuclease/phosphatase family protein [Acidobacteriaceae bacterium]
MNPSFGKEIETGAFAPTLSVLWPPGSIRIVDWNINRGLKLSGIVEFLRGAGADLILLQECDLNARRTQRTNIAQEIARKLQMNYVFGREFQELTQGSSDSPAYHGQATLSRWPLSNARIIRFKDQSSFWRPKWFLPDIEPLQERLGGRMALVTEMDAGGRTVVSYNFHLESRGNDRLRCSQLFECLNDARRYNARLPLLVAGDFNMDVSRTAAAGGLNQARFQSVFATQPLLTTPSSLFDRGRPIDWIFTRGPVRSDSARVHTSVSASDHFPLTARLAFT